MIEEHDMMYERIYFDMFSRISRSAALQSSRSRCIHRVCDKGSSSPRMSPDQSRSELLRCCIGLAEIFEHAFQRYKSQCFRRYGPVVIRPSCTYSSDQNNTTTSWPNPLNLELRYIISTSKMIGEFADRVVLHGSGRHLRRRG
jgi:hypothetical protein